MRQVTQWKRGFVLTMTSMALVQYFAPGLPEPERLNATSMIGALLVVGGSAMCALGSY